MEKMYYILGDCAGEIDLNTERYILLYLKLLDGLIIEHDESDSVDGGDLNPGKVDELAPASEIEADNVIAYNHNPQRSDCKVVSEETLPPWLYSSR